MRNFLTAAAVVGATAGMAQAVTVDFENELAIGPDDTVNVTNSGPYLNNGVTFTSGDEGDLFLVGSNGAVDAFVPNDAVTPVGSFGNVFLTGDFDANSAMTLSFARATGISFDIADIDGPGERAEQFFFTFYDGAVEVGTVFRQAGVAPTTPGDGTITTIEYTGFFDRVEITNRTVGDPTGANRPAIGWGIDNIEIDPVPLPAGMVLFLTAFAGLAAFRTHVRKA